MLFDKTLEVNAEIHNQDYIPLNCAIKNGLIKLVKESYTHPEIKDKLNINRKNNKAFNESLVLAQSNSIELYEFFEEMKIDKLELINDTLFYALGFGKIKLIKHLINKRVNGEYAPINFQRAIIGYDSVDYDNKERDKDFFEYVSYFANIENETNNSYINDKSKEVFFNSDLLLKIIYKQDLNSLNLYKKIISEEQIVKDIATIVRNKDDSITDNNQQLIEGLKWFFLESMETDFSKNKTIILGVSRNRDLEIYLEKIKLHEKMDNEFPLKNTANKKHKI